MVKLFIGNLPDEPPVSGAELRPIFEKYGTVTECEVIRNYGFVHVEGEEVARKIIQELNGHNIKGRPMKVEKSESKGPKKPSQKMFIGNVADGTTNEQLRGLFASYVEVLEADVIEGKNYGFVHVDSSVGRGKINQIIKDLNGYELNGNEIRVQLSTSGVRNQPGMAGDSCFKCGGSGHWSKECYFDGGRGGMRGGRGRGGGGPMGGRGRGRDNGGRYGGGGGGGYGGGRGGRGGRRDDGGYGGRSAPYPPPRNYKDFAEDTYEPRRGGGPMRGPDSYGGGGYGGGSSMYSRRSPAPRSGGGYSGGGGYGGGGYSGDSNYGRY